MLEAKSHSSSHSDNDSSSSSDSSSDSSKSSNSSSESSSSDSSSDSSSSSLSSSELSSESSAEDMIVIPQSSLDKVSQQKAETGDSIGNMLEKDGFNRPFEATIKDYVVCFREPIHLFISLFNRQEEN